MKLTRKAFMEKGAEVSAKRAMDFENMVKEKDASDSARMFPALMVLMSGLTMNRLADNLGLTKEDNEVDVTKEMFDDAMSKVVADATSSENASIITGLETTIFCIELSDALFGKEKADETKKADSWLF